MHNPETQHITERLERMKIAPLAPHERAAIWNTLTPMLHTRAVHPRRRIARYLGVLGIAALLSGGFITVSYADSAVPGDVLFAVDRAAEKVQIALASPEALPALRQRIVAERVREAAYVFSEIDMRMRVADDSRERSSDDSRSSSLLEVADMDRMTAVLHVLRAQAEEVRDTTNVQELDHIIQTVEMVLVHPDRYNATGTEVRFREEEDQTRLELRTPTEEVKIRSKDGVVTTEVRSVATSSWSEADVSSSRRSNSSDDQGVRLRTATSGTEDSSTILASTVLQRAEAKVRAVGTEVRLEFSDRTKDEFTTNANTPALIINAIIERHPMLQPDTVAAVLVVAD